MLDLNKDVKYIKGVGPARAELLNSIGIFNGELGIITEIDEVNKQIEVCFDDEKVAWYDFTNLDELEHSYSITIHKSQRK